MIMLLSMIKILNYQFGQKRKEIIYNKNVIFVKLNIIILLFLYFKNLNN